jgi:hypothetical protein
MSEHDVMTLLREANPVSTADLEATETTEARRAAREQAIQIAESSPRSDALEREADPLRKLTEGGLRLPSLRVVALGLGVAIAAGLLLVGLGSGGGGPVTQGPSRALAIDSDAGPWVEVRIQDGEAGAEEMTRELQEAGINAEVRLLPADADFVGHWMGFLRVDPPVLSPGEDPRIPQIPCVLAVPPPLFESHEGHVSGDLLAIRRDAALADARWMFYVGREPQGDERPQIVSAAGPIAIDPGCGSRPATPHNDAR